MKQGITTQFKRVILLEIGLVTLVTLGGGLSDIPAVGILGVDGARATPMVRQSPTGSAPRPDAAPLPSPESTRSPSTLSTGSPTTDPTGSPAVPSHSLSSSGSTPIGSPRSVPNGSLVPEGTVEIINATQIDGTPYQVGATILLRAVARDKQGKDISECIVWRSDKGTVLGRGATLTYQATEPNMVGIIAECLR